jgi:hypothetical protein
MPSPHPTEKPAAQQVRVFRITDIPDVMQRKLGWPIAAQLMRRWFKGAARTMTDQEKRGGVDPRTLPAAMLDDTTVSMQWVLGFPRVRLAYDRLLAKWNSPEGLRILALRIKAQAPAALPKGQSSWRLGDLSQPCKVLDKTCQVNLMEVGSLSDPLDDFYGAMGKAGLKLAVSGEVTPQKNGKNRVVIDELAVYLRDTYDFNDDWFSQPLGYWGFSGVQRGLQLRWDIEIDEKYVEANSVPSDRLYAVQNDDFQRYRDKYRRGGDFIIFSADARRVRLVSPLVLEV